MTILGWLALGLFVSVVGFVLWWLHVDYWVDRFSIPMSYDTEEVVHTGDGAQIELRRVLPAGLADQEDPQLNEPPVVLVHGVANNHRDLDLAPDRSLARSLSQAGRDVWLVTLRSGGLSGSPGNSATNFGALVDFDLPTAIRSIKARTGASQVDYVGYSMGGMILLFGLGRSVVMTDVRRAVILGSPARIVLALGFVQRFPRFVGRLLGRQPTRMLSQTLAFLIGRLKTPLHRLIYNPDNFGPGQIEQLLVDAMSDIPGPLQRDFAGYALDEGVIRLDGEPAIHNTDYISRPALFIAGAADKVAPIECVHFGYERWGSRLPSPPDKHFVVAGTESGTEFDYGHADLVGGVRAPKEVFQQIVDYLA